MKQGLQFQTQEKGKKKGYDSHATLFMSFTEEFIYHLESRGGQLFWLRGPFKRQVRYPRANTCPYKLNLSFLMIKQISSWCLTCFHSQYSYLDNFKYSSRATFRCLADRTLPRSDFDRNVICERPPHTFTLLH